MTEPRKTEPAQDSPPASEDIQPRAVVGTAFRTSLLVFVIGALPVIGLLIVLNLNKRAGEATEFDTSPPTTPATDEQQAPVLPPTEAASDTGVDSVRETGRADEKPLPETVGGRSGPARQQQ